ncbi:MAG: DnaA regulatory inactivator Hda [Pseudomonadota bacterium]
MAIERRPPAGAGSRSRQVPMALKREAELRFETFDVGANGEVVASLKGLAQRGSAPGLWLWGETGSGRSHLLQASCELADSAGRSALYLPLTLLPAAPVALEVPRTHLVALDDVECWLGSRELEVALMALYERQLAAGGQFLVAASGGARRLDFALADLASRCRALPSFALLPPDDEGLRRILRSSAGRQGLELDEAVLDFWLHRADRSLPLLLGELERLDEAALADQRRITIPLIKDVLGL